jgi:hypothetical protein
MYTVVETPMFVKLVDKLLGESERAQLTSFIAANPETGSVVPGSGGVRKMRWGLPGLGKQGGVRVIYFNRLPDGEIWLLLIYGKSERDNISASILKMIKEEIEND